MRPVNATRDAIAVDLCVFNGGYSRSGTVGLDNDSPHRFYRPLGCSRTRVEKPSIAHGPIQYQCPRSQCGTYFDSSGSYPQTPCVHEGEDVLLWQCSQDDSVIMPNGRCLTLLRMKSSGHPFFLDGGTMKRLNGTRSDESLRMSVDSTWILCRANWTKPRMNVGGSAK